MNKQEKWTSLHDRMERLSNMVDQLDLERTEVEDIDRMILMLEELEEKCRQYRREEE
ncbi:SE1561 family protein [Alkalicoccus luteus]|uniref:SE1561 family protein n=1 Tax=Alkalicoccus luteus TaxID=1237094 RepID=UPI004034A320